MRFGFIATHKKAFPVTVMCRVLEVSRTGYYDWCKRPTSASELSNRQLDTHIQAIFIKHKGRYGSPRITEELMDRGITCSENRVAARMKVLELQAKAKRKYKMTTDSNHNKPIAPNLLERDFTATRPNEKWTSDITYIWTQEGWLYLAVIMDLYSRAIIGWKIDRRMTQNLVCDALMMALWRRQFPTDVIVHSDRGSQYASDKYRHLLEKHLLLPSMSKRGDCYDNAAMESFFHSLKVELIHDEYYATREQATQSIFEYIECYYNFKRKHSTIGYTAPMVYDNLANHS
jgi:putative transposase